MLRFRRLWIPLVTGSAILTLNGLLSHFHLDVLRIIYLKYCFHVIFGLFRPWTFNLTIYCFGRSFISARLPYVVMFNTIVLILGLDFIDALFTPTPNRERPEVERSAVLSITHVAAPSDLPDHWSLFDRPFQNSVHRDTLSHSPRAIQMTRATRFGSYASVATVCYFLAWFSIVPIPFTTEETKDQIIPLVRTS